MKFISVTSAVCLLAFNRYTNAFLDTDVFPPTCEGCYCIPDENDSTCPSPMPPIKFNFTEQLKDMKWKNPILLQCNPYSAVDQDPNPDPEADICTLTDSEGNYVEEDLGPDAVCGILYDETDIGANNCARSYTTKSFANRQELETEGYTVTHIGTCGTCSSTEDLAVYIETPNLQQAGIQCGILSMSNETAALECYEAVGFSPGCARTWLYDTSFTRDNCLNICLANLGKPPNLNSSTCPLNDCINCNEVVSGPTFKRIAGRTRRGSGLLSYIIRNCTELVFDVGPLDPCPNGFIGGASDDEEAPDSSARISSTVSIVIASLSAALVLTTMHAA